MWAGAQLAALVSHRQTLPAGLGAAVQAAFRLPSNAGKPARAWPVPAQNLLPGPLLDCPCTVVAAVAAVGVVIAAHLFAGPGPGTERRRRLGVHTRARLARPRDLTPLVVPGPRTGRLIVGRVGGRLVATENRSGHAAGPPGPPGRPLRGLRRGPGPLREDGNVISGILDWEGPAILS